MRAQTSFLSKRLKLSLHLGLLLGLLLVSATCYLPLITLLDRFLLLDFSHLMFIFGLVLGLIYYVLCFLRYRIATKPVTTPRRYLIHIAPSTFVLNCFLWYFGLFFNKLFSESKDDAQYYQMVMIAFLIYFLTVKIGKEVASLIAYYHSD